MSKTEVDDVAPTKGNRLRVTCLYTMLYDLIAFHMFFYDIAIGFTFNSVGFIFKCIQSASFIASYIRYNFAG